MAELKFLSALRVFIKWPSPDGACAFLDKVIGAPISKEIISAKSFNLFLKLSIIFWNKSILSSNKILEKLYINFTISYQYLNSKLIINNYLEFKNLVQSFKNK